MRLVPLALRNPHLVLVAALMLVVLGILSFTLIPADLLPLFKTPAVQILTLYPGMPPVVVERDIMSRLQRWTGQSVGIARQEAKAMLGVCVVKDFFREGISDADAMAQVSSLAMSDMYYLPPGTLPPMVMPFDPTASVPLCLLSVSSETLSEKELYDVAYFELRNRLQSIPGVIAPAVYGGKLRRILAYVDREKLEARGLAPMDVVRALHEQSVVVPAGNMKAGETDYQIFANAMPANAVNVASSVTGTTTDWNWASACAKCSFGHTRSTSTPDVLANVPAGRDCSNRLATLNPPSFSIPANGCHAMHVANPARTTSGTVIARGHSCA